MKEFIRKNFSVAILISLFIYSQSVGYIYEYQEKNIYNTPLFVLVFFVSLFAGLGGAYLFNLIKPRLVFKEKKTVEETPVRKWEFPVYWFVLFVCYLPLFLAYYPGIAAYDSNIQVMYIMDDHIVAAHPVIHTLLLGGLYRLGVEMGRSQMGLDWYCVIQMLILSGTLAYTVYELRKIKAKKIVCMAALAFYGLYPVISVLSVSATKDIIFSSLVLLYVIYIYKLVNIGFTKKDYALFILIGIFLLLFRAFALYVLVLSCFLTFFFIKEKKRFIVLHVALFVSYFIVNAGLSMALDVEKASPLDLLCVPAQQMARAAAYNEEVMEEYDLEKYIPRSTVDQYNPYLADDVKFFLNADNVRNDKMGFIKEWAKIGIHYPKEYVDSVVAVTIGFWFMDDESNAYLYVREGDGLGFLQDARFTYNGEKIGTEKSYLPGVRKIYHRLFVKNDYLKIPVVKWLFSPALWIWSIVVLAVIRIYRKQYKQLIPMIFCISYVAGLIVSPACVVRYVMPLMVCVPFFIGLLFLKEE